MLRFALGSVAALFCLVVAAAGTTDPAARLSAAAGRFLDSLDEKARGRASYEFGDDERFDLRLAPIFLEGLPVRDMGESARGHLRELLLVGLGEDGLRKVETIMSLEREVARLERESWGYRWFQHFLRDPEGYYLAIFGEPASGDPWGFRFDGHHVSLNYTIVPGASPSATPMFLGAQPARVREGWERSGLRVLGEEEDFARRLYLSLDPSRHEKATIPFRDGRALFLGSGRRVWPPSPAVGLARGEMEPAQQKRLDDLVNLWLGNFAPELAAVKRARIEESGPDAIRFAWAGSATPGEKSYHRLQGPSFLVEFDNTLDGADHVHAIWRDFDGDFGEDLLARHYGDVGHFVAESCEFGHSNCDKVTNVPGSDYGDAIHDPALRIVVGAGVVLD